jgi:ADP-ribosylglycohydrolase
VLFRSDTNAAVAGQIFGTYVTYSNLPMDWISTLKHKQWLDRKIITFVKSLHV